MFLTILLSACASMQPVQVQAPPLDLPPIPDKYLQPCQEPTPLQAGTFEALYRKMLDDVLPWGKCIRDHDAVIALYRYQQEVLAKWKAQTAAKPSTWKWPWEK